MHEAFVSVKPEWIDENGHLHDARYIDAFHGGVNRLIEEAGLGEAYRNTGFGLFNLGMNLDFFKEVFAGDRLRITARVLDVSEKLLHLYMEMHQVDTGALSAANERLLIHVDRSTRRSVPFPPTVYDRLNRLCEAQADTARPAAVGRRLEIKR